MINCGHVEKYITRKSQGYAIKTFRTNKLLARNEKAAPAGRQRDGDDEVRCGEKTDGRVLVGEVTDKGKLPKRRGGGELFAEDKIVHKIF